MSLLKRFAFWLPLFSVINYIIELLFNPFKDIVLGIDLLLGLLFTTFGDLVYDDQNFKILLPGFLLHFFLWLLYGLIIDYIIRTLFIQKKNDFKR